MFKRFSISLLMSFSCVFLYTNAIIAQDSSTLTSTETPVQTSQKTPADTVVIDKRKRFEVGVQFTSMMRKGDGDRNGFGGRVGYDFATFGKGKYIATAEAEFNFLPAEKSPFDPLGFSGVGSRRDGKVVQGFFGAKVGRKFEKFGIFAKARPGFVRYSRGFQTYSGTDFTNARFEQRAETNAAFDVGGVLEFYPTKRITTRFDAGDTIVRFGRQNINGLGIGFPNLQIIPITRPSETRHNFQFSAGIGFRF